MADADRDAGVDPRFDPQFQRGYDPAKHGTRSSRAPASPPAPAPSPAPRGDDSDPHPDAMRVAPGTSEHLEDLEDLEPPRRNPYRLILLLASLAAIGGSALLLWRRIATDPYLGYGGYGGDVAAVFSAQFVDSLMAPLLTGGLIGLGLWLALGAVRRRDGG